MQKISCCSFLVYPLEEDNNIEEDYEKFLQATAVRAAEKVYHFMRLLIGTDNICLGFGKGFVR